MTIAISKNDNRGQIVINLNPNELMFLAGATAMMRTAAESNRAALCPFKLESDDIAKVQEIDAQLFDAVNKCDDLMHN